MAALNPSHLSRLISGTAGEEAAKLFFNSVTRRERLVSQAARGHLAENISQAFKMGFEQGGGDPFMNGLNDASFEPRLSRPAGSARKLSIHELIKRAQFAGRLYADDPNITSLAAILERIDALCSPVHKVRA